MDRTLLPLDRGSNVNRADNNGHWPAPMWAVAGGQTANARMLLTDQVRGK